MRPLVLTLLFVLTGCYRTEVVARQNIADFSQSKPVLSEDGDLVELGYDKLVVRPFPGSRFVDGDNDGRIQAVSTEEAGGLEIVDGRHPASSSLTASKHWLVVEDGRGEHAYPMSGVSEIHLKKKSDGRVAGIVVGSTLGGAALIGAIAGIACAVSSSGPIMDMGFSGSGSF